MEENTYSGIKIMSVDEIRDLENEDSNENSNDVEDAESSLNENPRIDNNDITISPVDNDDSDDDDSDVSQLSNDIKNADSNNISDKLKERYTALAKELYDEGLIDEFNEEDFEGTLDDLKNLFSKKIDKITDEKMNSYINSFSGAKRRFLEIGDAFDDDALAYQVAQDIEFFNQITEEHLDKNEKVQTRIYSQYLRSLGKSPEEIEEDIIEAKELGKLSAKAKRVFPQLKEAAEQFVEQSREQKAKAIEDNKKMQEEAFNSMLSTIDNKEIMLDGISFTKRHKDKLKEIMTTPIVKHSSGRLLNDIGAKQMKNPQEFEVLLNYYNMLGLFNTDKEGNFKPDISAIKKAAKSKAVKDLDRIIEEDSDLSLNNSNNKGNINADSESIINFLKKAKKKQ